MTSRSGAEVEPATGAAACLEGADGEDRRVDLPAEASLAAS